MLGNGQKHTESFVRSLLEDGKCRVSVGILFICGDEHSEGKVHLSAEILMMCGCYIGLESNCFHINCYKSL